MASRTKIVATVGPASSDPPVLRQLVEAGVDAFRLNYSHGTREGHAEAARTIREISRDLGQEVAIIQDL